MKFVVLFIVVLASLPALAQKNGPNAFTKQICGDLATRTIDGEHGTYRIFRITNMYTKMRFLASPSSEQAFAAMVVAAKAGQSVCLNGTFISPVPPEAGVLPGTVDSKFWVDSVVPFTGFAQPG